jgi:transcriptional regulator with XRE-family HTH domain
MGFPEKVARNQEMVRLIRGGMSQAEVAQRMGVSRQRVNQIWKLATVHEGKTDMTVIPNTGTVTIVPESELPLLVTPDTPLTEEEIGADDLG